MATGRRNAKPSCAQPLEDLFAEAAFLASLAPVKNGGDPLAEDWSWVRGHMETLLRLAQEFAEKFAARKARRRRSGFSRPRTIRVETALGFYRGQTDRRRRKLARKTAVRFRGRISGHQCRAGQNHRRAFARRCGREPFSRRRREAEHLPVPPGRSENFPRLRAKPGAAKTAK